MYLDIWKKSRWPFGIPNKLLFCPFFFGWGLGRSLFLSLCFSPWRNEPFFCVDCVQKSCDGRSGPGFGLSLSLKRALKILLDGRNPARKPVEVGSWNPMIYPRFFLHPPGFLPSTVAPEVLKGNVTWLPCKFWIVSESVGVIRLPGEPTFSFLFYRLQPIFWGCKTFIFHGHLGFKGISYMIEKLFSVRWFRTSTNFGQINHKQQIQSSVAS